MRTGSLNRPLDVLLTALANIESKYKMERHKLAKYLSEMLSRYPRIATKFARPNMQHGLLYNARYDHVVGQATCSQCNISKLIDQELRPSEDLFISL
jgi:hypothetical protein